MSGSTTPVTFTYTGKIVSYTVPTTGLYEIDAVGASGGNHTYGQGNPGGEGAEVSGEVLLTAGETLRIAVGGAGSNGM
jgi:hypothetical protein